MALAALPVSAAAAEANAGSELDRVVLGWPWALPFIGLLLSIAIGPTLAPRIWHAHYGKVAFVWSALAIAPLAAISGLPIALAALAQAILGQYVSFIALLAALYVVAGGILVTGAMRGTPLINTAALLFGTAIASIVGSVGAAMILIRPLLRANAARLRNRHVVVFFIILIGNIGGAGTPLGNPPLFVGFLQGVDFFWAATHLLAPTATAAALVLAIFLAVNSWLYRHDRRVAIVGEVLTREPIRVRGLGNLVLFGLIVGLMLISVLWRPGIVFTVYGTRLELQDIIRDTMLLSVGVASVAFTPDEHRERNGFSWEPIVEVAKLFAGIFVCIIPVMAMLRAGPAGPFGWLLALMTAPDGTPRDVAYFWVSGMLSAFLDNAPTFLVFFELAGGNAQRLMGELAPTLAAITMGSVYMGALTYIGNAPNLMIQAIAEERGIRMPSFFGFLAWSAAILLPVFAIITFVFVLRSH